MEQNINNETIMIFNINERPLKWKNNHEKFQLVIFAIVCSMGILMYLQFYYSFKMSGNYTNLILSQFWILFLVVLQLYLGVYKRGEFVNQTVEKVSIVNNTVTLDTFMLRILYLTRLPSKKIVLDNNSIRFIEMEFPLKDPKVFHDKSLTIKFQGKYYYILTEYFDDDLKGKLLSLNSKESG